MGYTPYKAQRMQSPMAQKSNAEPEGNKKNRNENKLETINQVTGQRADKYKKDVTGLSTDTSLSNNQKAAKNKELFANMKKANKSSTDSINRVTAADFEFVKNNIDNFSQDELDRMSKDGFFTKIN